MNPILKPSERIKYLAKRSHNLASSGKRNLYAENPEFLVYHWSGHSAAFAPATGDMAINEDKRISLGDHNCRVDIGGDFPFLEGLPSRKKGSFEYSALNWSKDYAYFLDNSPAEIYPNETIVGEFHWQLDEARLYKYPDVVYELGKEAKIVGCGGMSLAHTCPDLSIGLSLGWGGLLKKVLKYKEQYHQYGAKIQEDYLAAQVRVVEAISRYILKYSQRALYLASKETDSKIKERYLRVAKNCSAISEDAPSSFEEAIQWINLYQVCERIHGHGNGYGRLDQLLIKFYEKDKKEGKITREEARNLIAEMYLKYGGNYFSFGGRLENKADATNEVSWIGLEAYDITGGYNHLGLMWHPDIDKDFYKYGCEVLARNKCGTPTLVNYDVMRDSELYSGISYEDAWNVSYSGCQWYCVVGKEYSDQDMNCLVLTQSMDDAVKEAIDKNVATFSQFWDIYDNKFNTCVDVLAKFKNKVYEFQDRVWPEMVTSLCAHGPIEHGCDITSPRGVNNCFSSVNILGVPNVVDGMYALKEIVFDKKLYTLSEVRKAVKSNWINNEKMRQQFLNIDKFGNDIDGVDLMFTKVANHIADVVERRRNIKGGNFRPSLFQFMGHTYAGQLQGATYDGRLKEEPFAHGCNPMHKRNTHGITATANSLCKIDFRRFQGGSLQIELNPQFFEGKSNPAQYIEKFSEVYMKMGGVQANINIINLKQLKEAMEHPETEAYKNLVVKVTGFSAHFCTLDPKFQIEFLERVNYKVI